MTFANEIKDERLFRNTSTIYGITKSTREMEGISSGLQMEAVW